METKILRFIAENSLFEKGDTVTVALSGGADSMALLNTLISLSEGLEITVNAAHFNHKLRGSEAERDEQFVKDYCASRNIELFCDSTDVPLYCRENNLSVEEGARALRYAFLKRIAKDKVATAHNANDNLETALFNLARGTGLKGLCGIPVKRDIYIRPLLSCTRAEIEDYCAQKSISYVTDSTNLTDDYTRNRIRHNVLPILKEINPNAENSFTSTVNSLKQDLDFINKTAAFEYENRKKDNGLILKDFNKLHISVAKRVIMLFLADNSYVKADNFHINEIYNICLSGGNVNLSDRLFAVSFEGILCLSSTPKIELKKREFKVSFLENFENPYEKSKKINNLLLNNLIDCDKIVGKLSLRTRISGDKLKLLKSNGTKTLKKLYTEKRVSLSEREILPVLADDEGVVWVCEIGVAERCAVTEKSKNILKIDVQTNLGDNNVT